MNPALTSYVLVNADNQPVPLPFETLTGQRIVDFLPPQHPNSSGRVEVTTDGYNQKYFPSIYDLRIITENEFMARQAERPPFHLIDPAGNEVPLPHYLSDDQTVTSIDGESLICETTRSVTWLDPAAYGLTIIADCDLS